MDNFYEQLIAAKASVAYKISNAAFYVLLVLAGLSLATNLILAALYVLLAVGIFFFKKNLYIEYEYIFTNGEIDIDKIIEMKKRKRVFSFSVKSVELLAPEDSYYVKDFANKPSKVISVYPKDNKEKVFVAMITGGSERVQLRFVPSEEMLNMCYKYNPRAVKKA